MHTEEEAQKHICPIIGVAAAIAGSSDSIPLTETAGLCRASNCMMWRWSGNTDYTPDKLMHLSKKYGFCGLAQYPPYDPERAE